MPGFVGPTGVTLIAWLVLACTFTGTGALALRALGGCPTSHGFGAFWLGFAVSLAWLQLWSLWLPIAWPALLPLIVLGIAGWIVARGLQRQLSHFVGRPAVVLGVAVLAVWAAVTAQSPLTLYDAGTYHLSALRWAATYPVMPGLANLNPALGLGSSVFLYLDAVSIGGVHGFHIALGLLLVTTLLELAATSLKRPSSVTSRVATLLIMPALVFVGAAGFSTTMYDIGSFVLCIAIGLRLLQLLETPVLSRREALEVLFVITALSYAAMTVKISNGPFSAACIALAAIVVAHKSAVGRREAIVGVGVLAALGVVQILPWLVRNALLTGYPLYPLPMLALPVDWTVPEAAVRAYRDTLSDFARVRGPGFQGASANLAWLGGWIGFSWRDGVLPLVIGLVAPLILVVFARRLTRQLGQRWLVLVPLWVGVVAWFASAPDPRYAAALLWLVAAVPLAFWLVALPRFGRLALNLLFLAAVEMPNASYFLALVQQPAAVVSGQYNGIPDLPVAQLTTWTMKSGLQVYGPPPGSDQVWDAPLPASFWRPDDALRLRCPDQLGCGFTVR